MRQIKIDFLTPVPTQGQGVRWLRRMLWLTAIAFAAWEIGFTQQLLAENESLKTVTATVADANTPAGKHHAGAPPALRTERTEISWFDPSMLGSAERAVGRVRQSGADLRLDSLVFDANRRTLIVRGDSSRPLAVDQLAAELRAEFPQTTAGFPNVRNTADRAQFDIGLLFPATGEMP